jgi:hypothetical protein
MHAPGKSPGHAGPGQETGAGTRSWPSPPDPGDSSRRVAPRRAELRVSIDQVAVRAEMTPRYAEYVGRYPVRIRAAELRRLAAALETSPSVLLGAGLDTPPGHGRVAGRNALARLTRIGCRQLIAPGGIGRIAFPAGTGPLVLPVNFAVIGTTIMFRTSPTCVIAAYAQDPPSPSRSITSTTPSSRAGACWSGE